MSANLADDLVDMLRDELCYIAQEQRELDERKAAIERLLRGKLPIGKPETAATGEQPVATFTADDARQHEQRQPAPAKGRRKVKRTGRKADLTHEQLAEIRALAGKLTHQQIGERFGISRSTVANIISRKGCYEYV